MTVLVSQTIQVNENTRNANDLKGLCWLCHILLYGIALSQLCKLKFVQAMHIIMYSLFAYLSD